MIIGITGGRDRRITQAGYDALDNLYDRFSIEYFISGHCPTEFNIDKDAEEWARKKNIKVRIYPADWNGYGKKAGPKRNREMADILMEYGGILVLFMGESGTSNMKHECIKRYVPIIDLTEHKYSKLIDGI